MKTIAFNLFLQELNRGAAVIVDDESLAYARVIEDGSEDYAFSCETRYGEELFREQEVEVLASGSFRLKNTVGQNATITILIVSPYIGETT